MNARNSSCTYQNKNYLENELATLKRINAPKNPPHQYNNVLGVHSFYNRTKKKSHTSLFCSLFSCFLFRWPKKFTIDNNVISILWNINNFIALQKTTKCP